MNVLPLALNLAILTYFIGVLILALPIPYRQLKRWGIRLLSDAIMAAVLVSAYNIILGIGDFILNLLGYSWTGFMSWLTERTAILVTALMGLTYVTSWIKSLGYSMILSPLGLASSYITLALSAIRMMYFIASFIWNFRSELLALGLLLYSLPLRIGKDAGAFFIAASLIMYVGFPLMPVFVNIFQGATPQPTISSPVTLTCSIIDLGNEPIPYPVLRLYKEGSEIPIGVIKGDARGKVVLGDNLDVLPRNYTFSVEVLFMGYVFKPTPSIIRSGSGRTNYRLRLPNIIYQGGLAILLPSSLSVVHVKYLGSRLEVTLTKSGVEGGEVRIVKLASVRVTSLSINNASLQCSWSSWSWKGVQLSECVLSLGSLELDSTSPIFISISYTPREYPSPNIEERRIVCYESLVDIIMQYISIGIAYIYSFLFLPGVYLAALTTMAASLARVLGGGARLRLI
ncbi:MAG: hypothetical protein DRO14_00815 [Thermoprotei archaeon]|nr:MAG: hypothetical protein DRO14_00815 [Thermoprotei archaeon]